MDDSINVGDVIDVDVFVKDVQNLSGFQFNLNYNPAVLKVTKSSDHLFLASQQGSNAISISDPTPDSDGVYISAATEFGEIGTTDESGSGVLARITLEAVKAGSSPLTLTELILISVGPSCHCQPQPAAAGMPGPGWMLPASIRERSSRLPTSRFSRSASSTERASRRRDNRGQGVAQVVRDGV